MKSDQYHSISGWTAIVLSATIIAEVFISWLLSAMMTSGIHSLLSAEGIRWMLGSAIYACRTTMLVYILLTAIAFGAAYHCMFPLSKPNQSAFLISAAAGAAVLLTPIIIVMMPNSILRSVTGELIPSPFLYSLYPATMLGTTTTALVFGVLTERIKTTADLSKALSCGIKIAAPLLFIYIVGAVAVANLMFIFGML